MFYNNTQTFSVFRFFESFGVTTMTKGEFGFTNGNHYFQILESFGVSNGEFGFLWVIVTFKILEVFRV